MHEAALHLASLYMSGSHTSRLPDILTRLEACYTVLTMKAGPSLGYETASCPLYPAPRWWTQDRSESAAIRIPLRRFAPLRPSSVHQVAPASFQGASGP